MGGPVPVSSRIFVSYSHGDWEIVERIRERLGAWGHTAVFEDRDPERGIVAGAKWTSTLYQSIANAHVVLAVSSANSRGSRWCLAETVIAQSNGIRVIPVVVDGSVPEPHLAQLQAVDCTSGDLNGLRRALEIAGVRPGGDEIWNPDRPPFPGLRALEREDAALYFGREQELDSVLTDLERQFQNRQRSVLVIQGGSGIGKSSFVRAGLLPRLARNPGQWLVLPPLARYGNPLRDLVAVVASKWPLAAELLPVDAEIDAQRLATLLDQALRANCQPPDARAVLVLDQAEALTSESIVGRAGTVSAAGRGALRSRGRPTLPRRHPLRRIPPARRAAESRPGTCSDRRAGRARHRRARADRRRPGAGGPHTGRQWPGSPDGRRHRGQRQSAFACVHAAGDVGALRRAFGALVSATDSGVFVRRAAAWTKLPHEAHRVLDQLVDRRLLHRLQVNGVDSVELAHESLLVHWPELAAWVDENAEFLRWRRSFVPLVKAWQRNERADEDRTARVTWLDEGTRPQVLVEALGNVTRVVFSPDGSAVATAGRECVVFDPANGDEIARLAHEHDVCAVVFDPSGARLATVETRRTSRVFDVRTGIQLTTVAGHYWFISGTALAVSRDGRSVAVGYDQGAVFVYDIEDGTEQARTYLPGGVTALAFMTDDERLVIGSTDGHVRIVYRRPRSEVVRLHMGARVGTVAMCTNAEGLLFAAGSGNGNAVLVDDSQELWDERDGTINAIGIDAGGQYFAAGGDDGLCLVFDIGARQEVGYTDHRPGSVGVEPVELGHDAVALGGVTFIFHGEGLREMFDRDMERARVEKRAVRSVSISDDGRRILTGGADGTVQVLDPVRRVLVGRFDMGAPVDVAAISPSGALAAVAFRGTLSIRVLSPVTGAEPNWDVHSRLSGPMRLVFSPGGELLACVGATSVEVYAVRTAELVLDGADKRLLSTTAAFSPDGQLLALSGTDRSVRVYETGSWEELARFGHDSEVWCVAFSPNGRLIASGTDLRTAHVWDLDTGQEQVRLHHAGAVVDLAFGPDGTTLLTGSQDGTARLWPIAIEQLVEMAGARATRELNVEERERFLIGTEVAG